MSGAGHLLPPRRPRSRSCPLNSIDSALFNPRLQDHQRRPSLSLYQPHYPLFHFPHFPARSTPPGRQISSLEPQLLPANFFNSGRRRHLLALSNSPPFPLCPGAHLMLSSFFLVQRRSSSPEHVGEHRSTSTSCIASPSRAQAVVTGASAAPRRIPSCPSPSPEPAGAPPPSAAEPQHNQRHCRLRQAVLLGELFLFPEPRFYYALCYLTQACK